MRGRRGWAALAVTATLLACPVAAGAQGGGASSTGVITGRVADEQGAALPGVTVAVASASLIGQQTTVTTETGIYRFPALPPGIYSVTYELTGFATLRREGIALTLGFTAALDVTLAVATLQETVTVTGASPIIDTSATRVQENFRLDRLESIPNARDMWSLLAITPSVSMGRIDVGGNRAGTQTAFTAFGFGNNDQQVRVLVEGINTTEGTGGAGFYFDFGSFEEVFLGTAAQGAEMPHPGVQSQFLGKSGGNRFGGQLYADYENNAMQGTNISEAQIARGIRPGGNEIDVVRDANVHLGGPLVRDKAWWFGSYRNQFNAVKIAAFRFDQTFDTDLWNVSAKGTYQLNQHNRFIGYYQWGQKVQPNRTGLGGFFYDTPDDTLKQDSGSWVWKGEWNGTLSNSLYLETRYGVFGYYFPLIGYSDQPFRRDSGTRVASGGDQIWQQDRDRKQLTGAATWFVDGFIRGTHSVKIGGEMNFEGQWNGFERIRADNVEHFFNNGVAQQVVIGFPTARGSVGQNGIRNDLLAQAKLDHHNAFVNDEWTVGERLTITAGLRFDRYRSWVPEQEQLASTVAGFSIPARTFPQQTFFTWNVFAPRVGAVVSLTPSGRTVAKLNYGYFGHNPGPGAAVNGNPNQNRKTLTYEWTDRNGDRLFQFGEQGLLRADLTGPGGVAIDPAITQPYTHELTAFVEQALGTTMGLRGGFVYKTIDDTTQVYLPGVPTSAYTIPFSFVDIGVDGVRGTSDDSTRQYLGAPTPSADALRQVFMNVPGIGRFKTVELSLNRRMANRFSANVGGAFTWSREHSNTIAGNLVAPVNYPNSPNDTSLNDSTAWSLKASGTYQAPWGLSVSPVLRHQSGNNYGRTLTINAPAGVFCCGPGALNTFLVEPLDTRRMPNITVVDVRAEKSLRLFARARLRVFGDLFNLANTNAPEAISFATGSAFEAPTAIVGPRVARIGLRFEW
jgi:Carboxypeptidase regulatory-like domain